MHTIKVALKKRSYKIIIGNSIIDFLGKYITTLNIGSDGFTITNAKIKNIYGRALEKALKRRGIKIKFQLIPDTEKSKSLKTAALVIKNLAAYNKKKRVFIIALGGGVVGDLSGFIASIYKRGIPYIQIPSTLMAQVDSSIGGKTAVDMEEGKNLIGAFYQPRLVFSDTALLKTLNKKQVISGLAEIIKYGIIKDAKLFAYLEKHHKEIISLRPSTLEYVIKSCSRIKSDIVQRDEKEEKGLRTILNFGHTIAHAIEAASRYRLYNHGEAVGLGMLIASQISYELKLINKTVLERIENLIFSAGLPSRIKGASLEKIMETYYYDKKFSGSRNKLVLITGIGRTKIIENIPEAVIKGAIKKRLLASSTAP